jgi:hypothetical protein
MTGPWEPPGLRDLVAGIGYIPGWDVYLDTDNEGGGWLTLHIVSATPDSYQPERTIRVNHSFLVPMATYNDRTWKAWILDRYLDVWRHETGEFLTFDGIREFAPHHGNGEDPYRTWHVGDLVDAQVRAGHSRV